MYKMKSSPFIYGNTVSSHSFTNRKEETKKLYSNLVGGINTMIISPRRWGKSSLVEKVIGDIKQKNKGHKTVILDLFMVNSEEAFLEAFAREIIKASSSKWEDWVLSGRELFKQLIPKISLGINPDIDFSLSFDWQELKNHGEEILNLPEIIAHKKNIKLIVCLDEFQNIATYSGFIDFEKKMRAIWQRQKNVTYCLYGSKRHMMTDIFNNPSKPFYRFGDVMLLPKIETRDWIGFICNGFNKTAKYIDKKDAALIPEIMKNHPWYVQQLAHYTWNLTEKAATTKEIQKALTEVINANTPFYQNEIESISKTQLNLLKAVSRNETQFTSAAVMQKYKLGTPRNVSKNRLTLIKKDLINETNGKVTFLDPVLEIWFEKQFFKYSYNEKTQWTKQ